MATKAFKIERLVKAGYTGSEARRVVDRFDRGPKKNKPPRKSRLKNAVASQEEVNRHVEALDEVTLYAAPINKTRSGFKGWARGEVFQVVNPPRWTGSPFVRSADAERIYDMGYRKIIVMDGDGGYDVDLVMQP